VVRIARDRQITVPVQRCDVIRGVSALVRWAAATGRALPRHAVATVVEHLVAEFSDGVVRNQRRSVEPITTIRQLPSGQWARRQPAGTFSLLEATSAIGDPCATTTRQWSEARRGLLRMIDEDRLA
jgi:hypothetical protein